MLLPYIAQQVDKVLAKMKELGHPMKIASSYRTWAEQDALYAKGRTKPGSIVTNARGGESWHNYKVAVDCCFTTCEAFGDSQPWHIYGQIAREYGFEWGGDWSTFKDRPHIQMTFGQSEFALKPLGEQRAVALLENLSNQNMENTPQLEQWQKDACKFIQDIGVSKGERPLENITRVEVFELIRKFYLYTINKK